MKERPRVTRAVRFGVFEVDLEVGDLRKSGSKVKLQEQPFQMLAALLERPGQVVKREDLRQRLWSSDTFVDFDHGLNTAINKIREVLGDSANNLRFVETIPRRGYRFLVEVRGPKQAIPPTAENTELLTQDSSPPAILEEKGFYLETGSKFLRISLVVNSLQKLIWTTAIVRISCASSQISHFAFGGSYR